MAKTNAAALLRQELAAPGYRAAYVAIGTATDAYQPIERELKITRAVLQVLAEARHPFGVVTKSALIERDLDLLAPLVGDSLVQAFISLTTLDAALSRILEPRAASPQRRLREPEIERLLAAAAAAGAVKSHYTVLRLPWEVAPLFEQWLAAHFPLRAERVMNRVREMRGGRDYDARFGTRMKGSGTWSELIRQRFDKASARHGLDRKLPEPRADLFERPRPSGPQIDGAPGQRENGHQHGIPSAVIAPFSAGIEPGVELLVRHQRNHQRLDEARGDRDHQQEEGRRLVPVFHADQQRQRQRRDGERQPGELLAEVKPVQPQRAGQGGE